jgi:putative hydrolase of the HAD superfamily
MEDPLPTLDALDVLCLDLDDTILDNRSSLLAAWRAVSELTADRHEEIEADAAFEQLGLSTRWFWSDPDRLAQGRLDLGWARHTIVSHLLEALSRPDADLTREASVLYSRLREEGLRLHDGVLVLLERFRARVPRLVLVTNGATQTQRGKIERFELAGFFDHIQLEGEFGYGKPDRRVYENVLRVCDARPERCLMVGDNYEADVIGALEAGFEAAWIDVAGRGKPPLEPPRQHATVRSIAELAERMDL